MQIVEDGEATKADEFVRRLVQAGRIDGVIVASARPGHPLFRTLDRQRIPHVFVHRAVPGAGCNVTLEDQKGSALAVDDGTDDGARRYAVTFQATAAQLFRVLPALQNLADRSAEFRARIEVEAEGREPFDPNWLRNAVEEHFDEAGIKRD